MHTLKLIFGCWAALIAVWFVFRLWQAGYFETGLERLLGWSKANENWLEDELIRDSIPLCGEEWITESKSLLTTWR